MPAKTSAREQSIIEQIYQLENRTNTREQIYQLENRTNIREQIYQLEAMQTVGVSLVVREYRHHVPRKDKHGVLRKD